MIEKHSPEFAELLGVAICGISRHFCCAAPACYINPPPGGVVNGRGKLDPIYQDRVCEGRDGPTDYAREHYSSCGDQLHAILQAVGVRHACLNRKSLHGFEYGVNITRLRKGACPFSDDRPFAGFKELPPPGSLCLIWTGGYDAHALVIHGQGSDENHVITGNYGAGGMNKSTTVGASLADSPVTRDVKGYLHIGGSHRQLHTIITPAMIVPYIEAQIDLTGAIVTDEVIQALGARWDHA